MLNYSLINEDNIKIGNYKNWLYIPIGHRCGTTIALNHVKLKKISLPFDWGIFDTEKLIDALEDNLNNYIPDEKIIQKHMVNISGFQNKYGLKILHFNKNVKTGIEQYNRRIERMNNILNDGMHNKIFVFFNEDGLYDKNYLGNFCSIINILKTFCNFIKKKYNINPLIFYIDFKDVQEIFIESNIIYIKLDSEIKFNNEKEQRNYSLNIYKNSDYYRNRVGEILLEVLIKLE
jgi:hypothetical protein